MPFTKGVPLTAGGRCWVPTDLPAPVPGPGKVRPEVAATGVRGTDGREPHAERHRHRPA